MGRIRPSSCGSRARTSTGVMRATDFLQAAKLGENLDVEGKRVWWSGGGNVAIDAARTARDSAPPRSSRSAWSRCRRCRPTPGRSRRPRLRASPSRLLRRARLQGRPNASRASSSCAACRSTTRDASAPSTPRASAGASPATWSSSPPAWARHRGVRPADQRQRHDPGRPRHPADDGPLRVRRRRRRHRSDHDHHRRRPGPPGGLHDRPLAAGRAPRPGRLRRGPARWWTSRPCWHVRTSTTGASRRVARAMSAAPGEF